MNDLAVQPARLEPQRLVTRRAVLNAAVTVFVGVVASGLLPRAAPALAQKRATIKVVNESGWEIHHLYLSPTDTDEWGPDQLGEEIIEKERGSFTLANIPCDDYDIRLMDEDDDECIVVSVNLCGDNTVWKITNKILLACEEEETEGSRTHCPTV